MTLTYELCDARTYEVCHSFICDDALTHDVCEYVSQDVRHPCNDWCICSIPHLHPWQHAHVYNFKFAYECIIVYICNLYVSFAKETYKRGDICIYIYVHGIRAIICVHVPHIYTNYCTYGSPPDPINHVYSLPGKYMSQKYFTYPSVQIFKILFRGFILKNPTKIWFSAQDHAVMLLLLNIVGFFIYARQQSAWLKRFVPQLYQHRRGILEGPALKDFYMINR